MSTSKTRLNAVIGKPLGQSLSPQFHTEEYARRGHDAVLLAFENTELAPLIDSIRTLNIGLTAVTLPFKETILDFLDEVDPLGQRLSSVNTVLNIDGRLVGYNTDYHGISKALDGIDLKDKTILLLGAGGAAKAVAAYAQDSGANCLCFNRHVERAEQLVQRFGGRVVDGDMLKNTHIDLVVNATPMGMGPDFDVSPFNFSLINVPDLVFDLVYNPEETRFLREARSLGSKTISGLMMFKAQALEQIQLWETLVLNR